MDTMNWVDFAIIGIIGLSALISLIRGFVKEALSLLVWAVAIWLGITYAKEVVARFGSYIPIESGTLKLAAAFLVILFGVLVVGAMIIFVLSKLVQKGGLASTDRLFGMVFGAARGAALVVIAVLLAGLTPLPSEAWWQKSTLLPSFERLAFKARKYLQVDMAEDMSFEPKLPEAGATEGDTPTEKPVSPENHIAPAAKPPPPPQGLTASPPI